MQGSQSMQAPAVGKLMEKAGSLKELGSQKLNSQQRQAVASVLVGAGGGALPLALFGPPGTGKTVTLVECALQVTPAGPLYCSTSCWASGQRETSAQDSATCLACLFSAKSMSLLMSSACGTNCYDCMRMWLLASC